MSCLSQKISFNRFPLNKKLFFDIIKKISEADEDILEAFSVDPRMTTCDRIYFTMTESELKAVARRRGDLKIVDCFPDFDAVYSYESRCIILHIPAMVFKLSMALKISKISLNPDDPEGKVLFTRYLFCCLFHELGHDRYTMQVTNKHWSAMFSGEEAPVEYSIDESEKTAEDYERRTIKIFEQTLYKNGLDWHTLADKLFNWEKLMEIVTHPLIAQVGSN